MRLEPAKANAGHCIRNERRSSERETSVTLRVGQRSQEQSGDRLEHDGRSRASETLPTTGSEGRRRAAEDYSAGATRTAKLDVTMLLHRSTLLMQKRGISDMVCTKGKSRQNNWPSCARRRDRRRRVQVLRRSTLLFPTFLANTNTPPLTTSPHPPDTPQTAVQSGPPPTPCPSADSTLKTVVSAADTWASKRPC
jgi:hypothetical protein